MASNGIEGNLNKDVEQIQDLNENLDKKQELLGSLNDQFIDGTDIFMDQYFDKLTEQEKQKFIEEFEKGEGNDFYDYISRNSLPVTKKKFEYFKLNHLQVGEKFELEEKDSKLEEKDSELEEKDSELEEKDFELEELKEKEEDIQEQKEQKEEEKEKVEKKHVEVLSKEQQDLVDFGNTKLVKYLEFLTDEEKEKVENKEKTLSLKDIKTIIEREYIKILDKAGKTSDTEFTKIYDKFSIYNDSGLVNLPLLKKYKDKYKVDRVKLEGEEGGKAIIQSFSNYESFSNLDIKGDKFIYGDQVIDTGKRPPIKYIKTENGFELKSGEVDYKMEHETLEKVLMLENRIDNNNQKIQKFDNKISDLSNMGNEIQDIAFFTDDANLDKYFKYYNTEGRKNNEIREVIQLVDDTEGEEQIGLMTKLISMIEEDLNTQKQDIVLQKQKLEQENKQNKEYLDKLNKQEQVRFNAYFEKLKEQDEKTREILEFLNKIGYDMIPKQFTDQLIQEIKMNGFSIPGMNLNPKTIDLENGRFGEGETEIDGDKWKNNLVKFVEKMIYGENNTEDSIFKGKEFKGELGSTINKTEFNYELEKSGIKKGTGWDIQLMRNNLKKGLEKTKK